MLSFMLQDLSIRNDVPFTRLILLGNHTKVADGYSKSGFRGECAMDLNDLDFWDFCLQVFCQFTEIVETMLETADSSDALN